MFYIKWDLGGSGWNLCNSPIILLIFWVVFLYVLKSLTLYLMLNKGVSETYGFLTEYYWIKEMSVAIFLLNITSYACLFKLRWKTIFHWKAQLLIRVRSLLRVLSLVSISFTTEKRVVQYHQPKVNCLDVAHLINCLY